MIGKGMRWGMALWLSLVDRAGRNRHRYYAGAKGLRILNFHAIPDADMPRFRAMVEWGLDHFDLATPTDIDAIRDGQPTTWERDKLAFTFDDGYADHYRAACWLSDRGVAATFFVVPSFIGRSIPEYLEFHRARGVRAFDFAVDSRSRRGVSNEEIREMVAMGHRIGAHNYGHRSLGELRTPRDMDYEIENALRGVEEITGATCEDFAFAFGHPAFISDEAIRYLSSRCKRVYACVRGLNVPGLTPSVLLREDVLLRYPLRLVTQCMVGGADDRYAAMRPQLLERTGPLPLRGI
jgi:peptidoglycan/xylan/chitin deacetylase (PgdA/CDA1 family)